jgi:hypothetical protein
VGKTAVETVTMLKEAFKDKVIGKTQVYKQFNRFKRGEMSVQDQLLCGRPSNCRTDENVEKFHQAVHAVLLECAEKSARQAATKTPSKVAEWGLVLAP